MKSQLYILSVVIICFLLFSGCSEEKIPVQEVDLQEGYYPLAIGNTWIYETDSIVFNNQFGTVDTLTGLVKEVIIDSNVDAEGNTIFTLDRSFRESESSPWIKTATYTAYIKENQAIRVEDNLRFVKLVLPPVDGQKWDGNKFISEDILININGEQLEMYRNWDYLVKATDTQLTMGGKVYDNALEVELVNTENVIEKRYAKEYYVKGMGLVYREMSIIDTQNGDITQTIEQRAEKGFTLSQRLIDFY